LFLFVYGAGSLIFLLAASVTPPEEERPPIIPLPEGVPGVTARAWGVVDLSTGDLVYAAAPTTSLPIASVTKLLTAATLLTEADTSTPAIVTWSDVATEGRAGSLVPGNQYSYHELFFPLLLESSNDAATTLARALEPDSLPVRMNGYAATHELSMTSLKDPSGLSPENVSTIEDLARLLYTLNTELPHVLDITALRTYGSSQQGWSNNSPFIGDVGYRGGKHGYTPEAGKTAAVIFTETFLRGVEVPVGYIVLGSEDSVLDVRLLRELVRTRGLRSE